MTAKEALRVLVGEKGPGIYRDPDTLEAQLKQASVPMADICQIRLVQEAGYFARFMARLEQGLTVTDINNLIHASMETGLSYEAAGSTVNLMLESLGIQQTTNWKTRASSDKNLWNSEKTLYVPPLAYQKELGKIEKKIEQDQELNEDEAGLLNFCAKAQVPSALRMEGELYQKKDEKKSAMASLQEAAALGDAKALGLMGDNEFLSGQYGKAYKYYVCSGAAAPTSRQKARIQALYRLREFHQHSIIRWIVFAFISEIILIVLFPLLTAYHTSGWLIGIGTLLNIGVTVLLIVWYQKNPFLMNKYLSLLYAFVFTLLSISYVFH